MNKLFFQTRLWRKFSKIKLWWCWNGRWCYFNYSQTTWRKQYQIGHKITGRNFNKEGWKLHIIMPLSNSTLQIIMQMTHLRWVKNVKDEKLLISSPSYFFIVYRSDLDPSFFSAFQSEKYFEFSCVGCNFSKVHHSQINGYSDRPLLNSNPGN